MRPHRPEEPFAVEGFTYIFHFSKLTRQDNCLFWRILGGKMPRD